MGHGYNTRGVGLNLMHKGREICHSWDLIMLKKTQLGYIMLNQPNN